VPAPSKANASCGWSARKVVLVWLHDGEGRKQLLRHLLLEGVLEEF
jgi:hypothetical protein